MELSIQNSSMNNFEIQVKISTFQPNWPRIGVIGGGVSGVSTALAISKAFPKSKIIVFSDKITPNTTGDGAAGLWGPFMPYGTPEDKILKWSLPTWKLLDSWAKRGLPGTTYIHETSISKDDLPLPCYRDITYGFKELNQEQLKGFGSDYANGYSYTTVISEASYFLPNMMKQIMDSGGMFQTKRLTSLSDIADQVDIIVNCSGLGSYDIVPDKTMFPIRGQMIIVKAPWVQSSFSDNSEESFCYICPNADKLILGGTHQVGDWRTSVDEQDKENIYTRNCDIMPGIEKSEFVRDWVGLRPARKQGIRIEMDEVVSDRGKKTQVVHNYGHCGAGISLMWGCALEACELVGEVITKHYWPVESKL